MYRAQINHCEFKVFSRLLVQESFVLWNTDLSMRFQSFQSVASPRKFCFMERRISSAM